MERFTENCVQGHPVGTIFFRDIGRNKEVGRQHHYLVDELQSQISIANEEKKKQNDDGVYQV